MGADGWTYFVSYQPDLNAALHTLQQHLFAQGDYLLRDYSDLTLEQMLPPDYREWMDEDELATYRATYERLHNGPTPQTLEELREWNGEEGIGSILDMTHVGEDGAFGCIAPATPDELAELFGTVHPTHEQAFAASDACMGLRESWQGIAVVVYRGGVPDEIFFAGYSGD